MQPKYNDTLTEHIKSQNETIRLLKKLNVRKTMEHLERWDESRQKIEQLA